MSDLGSEPTGTGDLHGRPTAEELLDAVVGLLRDQVMGQIEGPMRHQIRIAVHALEVVSREMALGAAAELAHQERLGRLGMATDAELAQGIRDGLIDDGPELREVLRADTRDRLLVANPRWLPDGSA